MNKPKKTQQNFQKVYAHLKHEGKDLMKHLVYDVGLHHFEAMDHILTEHQDLVWPSAMQAIRRYE